MYLVCNVKTKHWPCTWCAMQIQNSGRVLGVQCKDKTWPCTWSAMLRQTLAMYLVYNVKIRKHFQQCQEV